MRFLAFLFAVLLLAFPVRATTLPLANVSTAGAQATATVAAVAGVTYFACGIVGVVTAGSGGASGIQTLVLRDGATGAGAILWSIPLSAPTSGTAGYADLLSFSGTTGNAMTVEFTGGASNSAIEGVALQYKQSPCP